MNWRHARQLYEYETENRQLKLRLTQKQCENMVLRSLVEGIGGLVAFGGVPVLSTKNASKIG
jgi:hypothetical protein